MATVTGYTKAKSDEIFDATIVDGEVDIDGHLILTTHGGSEIDAGDVRGEQGPAGISPTGSIVMFAMSTPPADWLVCDGSAVSRTTYAALYAVIGDTYGAGNGTTTFNLPNLKGRVPVGQNASDANFNVMGETGGASTHTLTSAEMPSHGHTQDSHNHTQNSHNHTQDSHNHTQNAHDHTLVTDGSLVVTTTSERVQPAAGSGGRMLVSTAAVDNNSTTATNQSTTATNQSTTPTNQSTTATNQNTGGGGAHNNLQPYIVLSYIIKT